MLKKRIIATLVVKNGIVVQSKNFDSTVPDDPGSTPLGAS